MEVREHVLCVNPKFANPEFNLDYRIATACEYAARFDKLPPCERDAVIVLHVLHSVAFEVSDRVRIRHGIDALMRPFYPGVDHARTP